MSETFEEHSIRGLPPKLARRMALLCLSGWRFEYREMEPQRWMATKAACREYMGMTLYYVLLQMDCEYSHEGAREVPDAPTI